MVEKPTSNGETLMEEKIKFYESALVPLLKKRNSDLIIAVSELESNLIMAQEKIKSLQEKINEFEVINKVNNISNNIEKKIVKNSKRIKNK